MRKKLLSLALVCAMGAPVYGAVLEGNALYETLFKTGTLAQIETGDKLVYRREVTNKAMPMPPPAIPVTWFFRFGRGRR